MRWQYRHTVLLLTTLAFVTSMVARLVISPLVPEITSTFLASTSDVGLALTGMWGAYALVQYPGGMLANRYGERRVIIGALVLITVASVFLAVAPVFPFFAVATVLVGGAAGLPYSATTSLLSKHFDDIGRAIGIYIAGGPFAGVVVPIVATSLGSRFGWRVAMLVAAVLAGPTLLAVTRGIRPGPSASERAAVDASFSVRSMVEVLTRSGISYTILLAVGGAFTWQATASFLPTFLVQHQGFDLEAAGLLFSAYFVVHGLSQPVTGWLSDELGRDPATMLTMGCATVGYALLVLTPDTRLVLVGVAFLGLGMSWGAPVQSRFMDQLSDAERTIGFGLVRTVYMTIGSLGSVVVGVSSDVLGWPVAFGLLACLTGGEVVLLVANGALGARY